MTTASRRRGTPSMPSMRPHQVQDFASRVHGTSTARAHRTMGAWPFLCVRGRPPLSMRVPGRYRSETLKARPPSPCRRGALLYEAAQGSYAHRRSTSLPRRAARRLARLLLISRSIGSTQPNPGNHFTGTVTISTGPLTENYDVIR